MTSEASRAYARGRGLPHQAAERGRGAGPRPPAPLVDAERAGGRARGGARAASSPSWRSPTITRRRHLDGGGGRASSPSAWFLSRYAVWATTHLVLTSDRLIYRSGVIAKRGIEIPLERINTVFSSQSVFERLLRCGDLVVESGGERGRQSFADIPGPGAVQNEIYRQMEANNNRMYQGRGSAGGLSVVEQLEKLDDLRRRGRDRRGRVPVAEGSPPAPLSPAGRQPRPLRHRDPAGVGGHARGRDPLLRAAGPAGRRRHQGPRRGRGRRPRAPTWWW